MPYTKADVLRCLEALSAEVKNRLIVRWAQDGKQHDPVVILDELIDEARYSLPEDAPKEYRP